MKRSSDLRRRDCRRDSSSAASMRLEVPFRLLLFHRRGLIVVDDAALTFGMARLEHLTDDLRHRRGVAFDGGSQRITAEGAKSDLLEFRRLTRTERHPIVVDHDPGAVAPDHRASI